MQGQSKKHSFIEAGVNTAIGYVIATGAQVVIFPWFGIIISLKDNLLIGVIFTVISIGRSYLLRRAFNWFHNKYPQ